MNWIIGRLKERSTWTAFILLAGIAGVKIKPEMQQLIIEAGLALVALVYGFTKDTKSIIIEKEADWRAPEATQKQVITTPDIDPNMGIKG